MYMTVESQKTLGEVWDSEKLCCRTSKAQGNVSTEAVIPNSPKIIQVFNFILQCIATWTKMLCTAVYFL